jgi:hypothetical protein
MRNTWIKLFLILTISCSYPDSPKSVAEKFLDAFSKHDFETAAEYGTTETAKMLKQIERIEELEKEKLPLPEGKIVIVSEEIEGSTAVVFFKEGSLKEEKLKLRKIRTDDGKHQWKVALTKSDLRMPEPLFGPAVPDSLPVSSF